MNPFPIEERLILKGLMEINAFCGNMDYINKISNKEYAAEYFEKNPEIKARFLKLRTFRNKTQKQLLISSSPIATALGINFELNKGLCEQMSKKRRELEKNRIGTYKPKSNWETKLLDSQRNIKNLISNYIPFLGINWDERATNEDTKKALEKLAKGGNIETPEVYQAAEELTKRQFKSLGDSHVPFLKWYQMKWLPLDKVKFLDKAEQIYQVSPLDGTKNYYLSFDQALRLESTQKHLIPFVDPDFYYDFNETWAIQEILIENITKMNPRKAHQLSPSQIKSITKDHVKNNRPFFDELFRHFLPDQKNRLHGNFLEYFDVQAHPSINEEHIREITDIDLIPKLERIASQSGKISEGLWTSWISPSNVKHIRKEQLPYLDKEAQISEVPPALVPKLDSKKQVKFIVEKQAKHLKKEQIPDCPKIMLSPDYAPSMFL